MVLTNERAELFSKYLLADKERAKKLLEMTADEALEAINSDGNDFTIDEIKEFGEQLQAAAELQGENGELDADALNNVSGGVVISGAVLAAGVSLFTFGVGAGYKVARDRGW